MKLTRENHVVRSKSSDGPGVRSYLLCGTPRTGSTLLCAALRDTGVAGVPESYFRGPDDQQWADVWGLARHADGSVDFDDFVSASLRAGTTPNGVFGARVMWGSVGALVERLREMGPENQQAADDEVLTDAFGPLSYIYLRRDDTIAQAVSWARAEQTGFWHEGDRAGNEAAYNFAQIDEIVRTIADHNRAWEDWFGAHSIAPLRLTYEAVTADLGDAVRSCLATLGCTTDRLVEAAHQRQSDALNASWAARYRSKVAGTDESS